MWICFNDGFVSAVQMTGKKNKNRLVVRARRKAVLKNLFGPKVKIMTEKDTDYRHRVFVTKERFASVVVHRIVGIDYGNFKNSVSKEDDELHFLYTQMWFRHRDYQESDPDYETDKRRLYKGAGQIRGGLG